MAEADVDDLARHLARHAPTEPDPMAILYEEEKKAAKAMGRPLPERPEADEVEQTHLALVERGRRLLERI